MCIKDWNVILDTPGKQLNLITLLGAVSVIVYSVADVLQKKVSIGLCDFLMLTVIKGLAVFLAAYYFVYCIILTKKIVEKYYK